MKYTIHGFSQKKLIELGMSSDDALILRWLVDFSQTNKMKFVTEGDKIFYWLNYQTLLDSLPILNIKKDTLYRKMKKLCEKNVLIHKCVRNKTGVYSYYGFGNKYIELIENYTETNPDDTETNPIPYGEKSVRVQEKTPEGFRKKLLNKDYSINNSSINNSSIKYIYMQENENDIQENNSNTKEVKHKYGEYKHVMLTDKQLADLKESFPNTWEGWITRVDEYCESHGKTYKNYLSVIKSWSKKENNNFTNCKKEKEEEKSDGKPTLREILKKKEQEIARQLEEEGW